MRFSEDLGVLHAQADQVIDIEEAAVIDLLTGHAPVGQAIHLQFEQQMQQIEAAWVIGSAVDVSQRACCQFLYCWRLLKKRLPLRAQFLPAPGSFFALFRIAAALLRQGSKLLD